MTYRSYTISMDSSIETGRKRELVERFIKFRNSKRKYFYLRKYDLTPEKFEELKKAQNYCCAICNKKLNSGRKVHIDHDHYTGVVRGVLCSNCNLGLGNFKDSITSLESAIEYLKKAQNDVSTNELQTA